MPQFCSHCGAEFARRVRRCPQDGAEVRATDVDPLLGTVFGDRYRLIDRLGSGAMGNVYRAEHVTMGRPFAIKVMLGDVAAAPQAVRRFHREAKAMSRLHHRNIVTVADFGQTRQGLLYIVEEFIDGRPLTEELVDGAISVREAVRIGQQVARALAHAHTRGVIHRDLKTANIMLVAADDEPDVVKLVDFGIARLTGAKHTTAITKDGIIIGTPSYMSPEQALGETVDHRADLYSLGIILYELLAGRLPFTGAKAFDLIDQHVTADPPPLSRDVPDCLAALTFRLLAKDPDDRYTDASVIVRELSRIQDVYALSACATPVRWDAPPAATATSGARTAMWLERERPSSARRTATWALLFALAAVAGAMLSSSAY